MLYYINVYRNGWCSHKQKILGLIFIVKSYDGILYIGTAYITDLQLSIPYGQCPNGITKQPFHG